MTKRLKVYLLIAFAAACLACTVAGCKIGRPGRAELLSGYDGKVTYYSNGGKFNDSETISVIELYYKAGDGEVPFFNIMPNTSSAGMKVERRGYDFIGWYEPERYTAQELTDLGLPTEYEGEIKYEYTYTPDADGNISEEFDAEDPDNKTVPVVPVIKDGNQVIDLETDRPLFTRWGKEDEIKESGVTVVCSDTLIADSETNDFTIKRDTDETVCALWVPSAKINYYLSVTDETGKVSEDTETEYTSLINGKEVTFKNGDLLTSDVIVGDGETPADRERVVLEGLTFVKTYMDEELTQKVEYVPRPDTVGAPATKVYCRYIVGNWTVINANDSAKVRQMFESIDMPTRKFLIMDDIEYTGSTLALRLGSVATSEATIIVNGDKPLTISNLKFAPTTITRRGTYSIFCDIGKTFKVGGAGLILKDINISLPRTNHEYSFYAVCTNADPSAAANMNLTIDTITATYGDAPEINDGDISHWLFGGAASDQAFLDGFSGIKLTGNNTFTKEQEE